MNFMACAFPLQAPQPESWTHRPGPTARFPAAVGACLPAVLAPGRGVSRSSWPARCPLAVLPSGTGEPRDPRLPGASALPWWGCVPRSRGHTQRRLFSNAG